MATTAVPGIKTLAIADHIQQFTTEPAAAQQLLAGSEKFAVMELERLYAHYQYGVPPTRSTGHSLVYITSGQGHMRIGNDSYSVGPQQLLLTRAGQLFAYDPGHTCTGILCHFQDELLLGQLGTEAQAAPGFEFLQFWGPPVIELPPATAPFVEQVLRRLLAEFTAHQLAYPALVRAYLLALLHEVGRAYSAQQARPVPHVAALALTNQFKQLVATSLREAHRVRDYAERLHVSADYLSRCVRRVTGKSPARWLEESIILEAKALLFQSTWPVSEVAAAVGIEDSSYFSRLFKKHTGQTPLAFRKAPH